MAKSSPAATAATAATAAGFFTGLLSLFVGHDRCQLR